MIRGGAILTRIRARRAGVEKARCILVRQTIKNHEVTLVIRQQQLHHQRRTLSMGPGPPASTPAPSPIFSMTPPRVVSRRAWQQQQHNKNAGKKTAPKDTAAAAAKKAANDHSDKPWPKSVRIMGYTAAVTLIPYFTLWLVSSNPTLRSLVLLNEDEEKTHDNKSFLENVLREHFGHEDEEEEQTATHYDYETPIPRQLPEEWPYSIRMTQTAIRSLEKDDISVRIGLYVKDDNSNNNNDDDAPESSPPHSGMSASAVSGMEDPPTYNYYQHLPGTTLARIHDIYEAMKTSVGQGNSTVVLPFPSLSSLSSVSLDFEEDAKKTAETTTSDDDTMTGTVTTDMIEDESDDDKRQQEQKQQQPADPLLKKVSAYSLWHYQDPGMLAAQTAQSKKQQATASSSSSTSSSNNNTTNNDTVDSIEIERLQFELEKYEAELKDAANSSRPVDDIMHDVQETKAALRSAQRRQGKGRGWFSW